MKIADLTRDLMLPLEEMEAVLQEFEDEFIDPTRGIQLRRRGRAVRIEVKEPYIFLIGEFFQERRSKPICDQSNELLAVIAHTQPVSVQGISDIRGSGSDQQPRGKRAEAEVESPGAEARVAVEGVAAVP